MALRELLSKRLEDGFVGRREERETLLGCLREGGPLVLHVHGIAGIGKTTLLRRFAADVEQAGGTAISLDCREVEPTARGFISALGSALEVESTALAGIAGAVEARSGIVVLILDDYQDIFLADTWVRQTLLPALPLNARVVFGSREPPLPGWLIAPEWQGLFIPVPMGPLSDDEALELVERAGLAPADAAAVNRLAFGHPLALQLAARSFSAATARFEDAGIEASLQRLADLHLSGVQDPALKEALQASSVIRRTTVPLLAALLPGRDAWSLYERMQELPYMEAAQDGLVMHGAVQKALATSLRAADPERYRQYREAAWRALRSQSRSAGIPEMWRFTADMLYLLDNPHIREAFFPTTIGQLSAEQATPADWPSIERIASRHEPPAACAVIAQWWRLNPHAFTVMRGASGELKGFYIFVEPGALSPVLDDPLFVGWQRHLREAPLGRNENVVFVRRWLSDPEGEMPSSVQGKCWLSVKQSYMALRPHLRRCYIAVSDVQTYGPVASALGFRIVEGASAELDGTPYHLAVLDLGPDSVDGWLSNHIARELGLDEVGILDIHSHELVLDGERTHLTPLEFETMRYLTAHIGQAVSRADLLESVWGYHFDGESNVVDTLIAGLRRKLGDREPLIETVRGVGYRLRRDAL
jgi:transcriptional regulator/AAA ATPase-like protein